MVKIAAVVVTYNRKECLLTCLSAIRHQTLKPEHVYIVDNASCDGTEKSIIESGYYNSFYDGISFEYIRLKTNTGGAGGFYSGMKTAYEARIFDAVWVMDDDGIPEAHCLENLTHHLGCYDFIAPVVLSDNDCSMCSFIPGHPSYDEFVSNANLGLVLNVASPFNGILFSKRLIHKVGFPKKEMFIWGDENNYQLRCEKFGFVPVTVTDAIHYHPMDRQKYVIMSGYSYILAEPDWKLYCLLRNKIYNSIRFSSRTFFRECLAQCLLIIRYYRYFVDRDGDGKLSLLLDALFSGIFGRFGGQSRYFPNA